MILSITKLSIVTLSIMTLALNDNQHYDAGITTFTINYTQHNDGKHNDLNHKLHSA